MLYPTTAAAACQTSTSKLNPAELAKIRSCLTLGLRSRLAHARACQVELEAARLAYAEEPGALTRIELDFWTTTARLGREAAAELEQALARIREDGFGACRDCGASIPAERLVAVPGSELCAACHRTERR